MKEQPKTESMLGPYRVLDLADEKGFLCGKILGDLGADVIKIEPLGGDPSRRIGPFFHDILDINKSLFWFAFNNNKRGITLDIEANDGRETFKRLVERSDFVIESFPSGYMDKLGLGYLELSKVNPRIIMTSITPFGQAGPYKDYKAPDIVAMAMSGYMSLTGDPDRPPVRISFPQAYLHAAADAAAGTMLAHYQRELTGEGQWVDVSAQEALLWIMQGARPYWELLKINQRRGGALRRTAAGAAQRQTWPCKDGSVGFLIYGGGQLAHFNKAVVKCIEDEGKANEYLKGVDWDTIDMATATQEFHDLISEVIGKFFMTHTKSELYERAIKWGFMLGPSATAKDLLENAQLANRDFWVDLEHPELGSVIRYPGAFIKTSETPCQIRRRAPLIGEHNQEVYDELSFSNGGPTTLGQGDGIQASKGSKGRLPLDGIKIVDFTWNVAGPWMTRYLADYGAAIVLVESGKNVNPARTSPPFKDLKPGLNRSGWFPLYTSNKYSITLDLRHRLGMEVAKRLVAWADIVVESFRPGTMQKLGLGYEDIRKIRPDTIMISSSSQGQTGPHTRQSSMGTQLTALAGFKHFTGWPDRLPVLPFGAYTDSIAPRLGVAALMAALDYCRRTGKGQYLDLSQYEAGVHFLAPVVLDYAANKREASRTGNRSPDAAPHGAYPCRGEDRWCVIAVFTDEEWGNFCRVLGDPDWAIDPKFATLISRKHNEEELDSLIGRWTVGCSAEEVMTRMQAAGVAAGVVKTPEDIHNDPQLKHRHHFQVLDHSEMGLHSYDSLSFRLSNSPAQIERPAPCLGEHTEFVCHELLGMTDDEFVDLLSEGAFGQP